MRLSGTLVQGLGIRQNETGTRLGMRLSGTLVQGLGMSPSKRAVAGLGYEAGL